MLRALGVIPARYASTRFRGKPLAPLGDGTMIGQVWRRACAARRLTEVVIATDDERIAEHARELGAGVRMTSPGHPSGSDRVAEVAASWPEPIDVVVNVQGDEPLVTGTALDRLVETFEEHPDTDLATLAEPMPSIDELLDPGVVKVVTAADGRALYFSRSPVPFPRTVGGDAPRADVRESLELDPAALSAYRKHQGIYAYRREVLLALTALPPSPLERMESLEQLRALEAGYAIRVLPSDFRSIGVDTPADLARVGAVLAAAPTATPSPTTKEFER